MLRVSRSTHIPQLLEGEGGFPREGGVVGLLEGDHEAVELVELLVDVVVDAVPNDAVLLRLGPLHQSTEKAEKSATGGCVGRAS